MNLRQNLASYIALNNYVSAYRDNNTVPAEYTQIEYVERPSGTTEQCVETTWKPNLAKNIVIQGKATFMGSDTNYRPILLGNYTGSRTSTLNIEFDSRTDYNFRVYTLAQNSSTGIDLQVGPFTTNSVVEFNVNITGSTGALDVSTISNGIILTGSSTVQNVGEQTNNVMMLFKDHRPTTTSASKVPTRIYYLKAIEDGITKIDLIPAIRNSDSEVGFYDKVSGQFLTNIGTGSLTGSSSIVEFDSNKLELTDAIHDGLEDLVLYGSTKAVPTEYLDTVSAKGNSKLQMADLPLEYTQVDYAIKKGTAGVQGKFDTGIMPTVDDVKIEMKVKIGDEVQQAGQTTVGSFYACQSRATASAEITGISGSLSTGSINGMQNGQSVASGIVRIKDHIDIIRYEYKNGNHSIYVKDLTTNTEDTQTGTYTFSAPTKNLYIFGNTTTTNNLNNNNTLYYCKIWVSGSLAFDAVPVIRNSDNVVGLYDKVSQTFIEPIISEGGGFIAGDATTPTPSEPMDIYCNNGILVPYLDGIGSTTQSSVPTPTSPISMINYTQGNVELRAVGTYKDTLTHGTFSATITRNVGVKVFNGTEDFSLVSGYTDVFRTPNNAVYPSDFASNPDSNVGLCNNYKVLSTSTSLASNIQDGEIGWNTIGALTVKDSRFTTAASFKSWLAQMYAAGTPVIVYYPLATSTTESVPPAYGTGINRDYEELEYITTTGTQYIETDLSGAMRWVGSGQGTSEGTGSQCILSCLLLNSSLERNANYFVGSRVTTYKYWAINTNAGGNSGVSTVPTLNYAEYDIVFTNNKQSYGIINNDNVFYEYAGSASWTYNEWYIGVGFGANNVEYYFTGNIYRQKAYQNGKLVGDFIPARRKSDNVVGMYDAVSNKFYTNSGTGDFVAGPSVHRNIFNTNDITGQTVSGVTLSIDPITGVITTTGATTTTSYSNFTYTLSKPLTAGTYTVSVYNSETMSTSLVGFGINGAVSNRNVSFSTATNNTATFTIPEGSVSDQVQIRIAGFADDPTHQFKFKIQVEEGSTGTSYINSSLYLKNFTYKSSTETLVDQTNYIATCQDLLGIVDDSHSTDDVDTQEVISGEINRSCRIAVLDGTENWTNPGSPGIGRFVFTSSIFNNVPKTMYCSHFDCKYAASASGKYITMGYNASNDIRRLVIANTDDYTESGMSPQFKQWLREQYAAGTPVIVVFPQISPTIQYVDPSDCVIGQYIADGGVITSNAANYYCSTYFPVLSNATYTVVLKEPVWSFNIAEYNSNKEFIQRTLDPTPHGNKIEFSITTTSNTRFIRIGNNTSPDGGVSNPTSLEIIQKISPKIVQNTYIDADPQVLKKAPVEITQAALPDLTVDTTTKTISTVSPDYPLDIACNNGIFTKKTIPSTEWNIITNPSPSQPYKAIYINTGTSKWSRQSDRGAGAVIPLKIGSYYIVRLRYDSNMNSTFFRGGQVDESLPPETASDVYGLQYASNISASLQYTFFASHPYYALQMGADFMEAGKLPNYFTITEFSPEASSTDYEQLEYIEGTITGSAGSYIDTGIKPTQNTKVEVRFSVNELGTNQCVIGGRNSSSGGQRNSFSIWGNVTNKIRFDYQSSPVLYPSTSATISANTIYTVIKDREKNYVNSVQQNSNDITAFTCNYSMLLFAVNSGVSGTQSCLSGKIYYCKIWDNDILVRDFIPVKRVSDNTIGIYDRVSGTFFTNSGTGDFTAGPSKGALQNTETAYVNSKNLYNTATDIDGQYIAEDGTIATSSTSCYSDIIPVIAGQTYTWSGICGNSGNNNNKRVHAYIDGVWNQQVSFIKIDANVPFSITFTVPVGCNGVRISHWNTDKYGQVEKGYRPTRYEVYGRDVIKPLNLLSAGIYSDNQNITTGITTHKIGVIVFNGNEDWTWTANANAPARLAISELEYNPSTTTSPLICSHFTTTAWDNLNATTKYIPYIAMNATQVATAKRIVFTAAWNNAIVDVDTWKAWLKDQYDRGTPVTVIYPITTAYTETNNPQDILLTSSNSEIERDSEYINNLGISVNYKKLK